MRASWDPLLTDSWRILHDAGRTTLKVKPDVLKKVNKVLNSENWSKIDDLLPIKTQTRNITNKTELVEQIIKLQDEAGGIVGKRMSSMEDLMDDIDHFLVNFAEKPGAGQFVRELTESGNKMAGGSFILRTIRNNTDELGAIVRFETTIQSQVDDIGDIVVDVITEKGVIKNVFNEFKNWQKINPERYASFTKQFVGYLTNKDIGGFYYFFRQGIDGNGFNNLSELKEQVVNAFSSSAGRAELSKLDLDKIRAITDNPLLDDMDKVDGVIDYLGELDNFEQIFKLID